MNRRSEEMVANLKSNLENSSEIIDDLVDRLQLVEDALCELKVALDNEDEERINEARSVANDFFFSLGDFE